MFTLININMELGGYVYILTNRDNSVIYTGSTTDLINRLYEHVNRVNPYAFTAKYNCFKLVYFEFYPRIEEARYREFQIKNWKRQWKIELIESKNPNWKSLNKYIFDNL